MTRIDLSNRIVLEDGTVICRSSAMVEMLYSGMDLTGVYCEEPADEQEWLAAARICDSDTQGPVYRDSPAYNGIIWTDHWFTPEPYSSIDIHSWCHLRAINDQEHRRIDDELAEMEKRNMIPLLRHLIYCVDTWRANGIVWGVGRGSSVSSLVLHKIGINRINPLDHGLEITEWLK